MLQLRYKILRLHFKTNVNEAEKDKYINCWNMWNKINFNYIVNRMECCLLPVLLLDVCATIRQWSLQISKLKILLFQILINRFLTKIRERLQASELEDSKPFSNFFCSVPVLKFKFADINIFSRPQICQRITCSGRKFLTNNDRLESIPHVHSTLTDQWPHSI